MHLLKKSTVIDEKYCLFRWFLFLFLISVSTASMPCTVVNSLGLFGEVKASVVSCEEKEETAEAAVKRYKNTSRGIRQISVQVRRFGSLPEGVDGSNIFSIWFVLFSAVLYFYYVQYRCRLPKEDTIVTLKVRMDN